MSRLERVLAAAARANVPSEQERSRLDSLANSLLAKTSAEASKHPHTRGALLGGSYAKGTWLPGLADLDIFVRFDPETPEAEFERLGLAIGAAATRGHPRGKKYAQHPYTEATVGGIRVNVVPCYAVEAKAWKSAADRSPYHVELVRSLPESAKAQVKLLKRFMKVVGVYGAEIETQGFSGYAAEVLVMRLGSLQGALKWFAALKPISVGKFFALPDPVDDGRDLATAVSKEKLGKMVLASREFLSRPSPAFFQKLSGRPRPHLNDSVIAVAFSHRALSEDTLWGELRKTTKHIVRHLEVEGFRVARSMAASNNKDHSAVLLIPEFATLPELQQRVGPTVDRKKDLDAFLRSNRSRSKLVWVDEDARVRLLAPRKHQNIAELLAEVASGKAGPIGASKELEAGMKRSARILRGASLTKAASSSGWLSAGIREISTDAIGTRRS